MKKSFYSVIILIVVITISLSQAVISKAQEATPLVVAESSICRDVVNRQPIGAGDSFEASVGKLYCFTKIIGAQKPVEIAHVWYFGDTLRVKVNLPIKSSSWRTYSTKKIQAYEIGDWYVDLLGPDGEILQTLQFKITP